MKKTISLLLALVLCLSLCACIAEAEGNSESETTQTDETPIKFTIGDTFGTDSIECSITNVCWLTADDLESNPAAHSEPIDPTKWGKKFTQTIMGEDLFPGYQFLGQSGVNDLNIDKFPYILVTFTLKNIGKTIIEAEIVENDWGGSFADYGNISIVYDDGYTFDSDYGFSTTLEVLGDEILEGRIISVPNAVFENEDKPLSVKVTLPASSGESEEFFVSVR